MTDFKENGARKGTLIEVKVFGVNDNDGFVIVETPFKHDGFISISEFTDKELKHLKRGDTLNVVVDHARKGILYLSKAKADKRSNWKTIENAYKNKLTILVQIEKEIEHKFFGRDKNDPTKRVEKSYPAYLGKYLDFEIIISKYEISYETKLENENLIGLKLPVNILHINSKYHDVIASEKAFKSIENEKKRKEFMEKIDIGVIFEGKAVRIDRKEKCFIVIKDGIKGKLKFENVSWDRYQNPIEVLKIGDNVKTVIVDFDKEKNEIWLSIKDLEDDFWENVDEFYKVGETVEGPVYRIFNFGAIITLEHSFRALIPNGEITLTRIVRNPDELIKVGETLKGIIIEIDRDTRKIIVSIKDYILLRYNVGDVVKGKIIKVQNYGAFIELEPGVTGLLKVEDISWSNKLKNAKQTLKEGEIVEAKILNINPQKRQIDFGVKQILPNPWDSLADQYQVGTRVKGTIVKLIEAGAFVSINDDIDAFLHVSNIPKGESENWQENLKEGDEIEGTIIIFNPRDQKIQISLLDENNRPKKTGFEKKYSKTPDYSYTNEVSDITLSDTLSDELLSELKQNAEKPEEVKSEELKVKSEKPKEEEKNEEKAKETSKEVKEEASKEEEVEETQPEEVKSEKLKVKSEKPKEEKEDDEPVNEENSDKTSLKEKESIEKENVPTTEPAEIVEEKEKEVKSEKPKEEKTEEMKNEELKVKNDEAVKTEKKSESKVETPKVEEKTEETKPQEKIVKEKPEGPKEEKEKEEEPPKVEKQEKIEEKEDHKDENADENISSSDDNEKEE
ncbi:S1 RNA-binding domain-containing protein [bacterium]|nr:S1 RNA-binding domain-containing protein [bacterium]